MGFELWGKMVYLHGGSLHLKFGIVEKRLKKVDLKKKNITFEREKIVRSKIAISQVLLVSSY